MNVFSSLQRIDVFLDEKYNKPEKHKAEKLISKGFHQAIIIQDFPIRERMVYLDVRCRRWISKVQAK
ncbi:ISAon1 family transposase N-terminal region protein [Sunxiuqinia sp. A32]|uniref:ISAon1 family transposase N-terminal region protein n=1 Tax=Sunxiuqinia sp. A32 TaxID=3461496 RepID=UPI004045AA81